MGSALSGGRPGAPASSSPLARSVEEILQDRLVPARFRTKGIFLSVLSFLRMYARVFSKCGYLVI